MPEEAPNAARDLGSLTSKPVLFVANVDEGSEGVPPAVVEHAAAQGAGAVAVCSRIEAEVSELDESEAAERTLHGRAITVENGFYKRADILRDYAAGTQRDMSALDWYVALGAYKLAIIAEGITARFLMGMTVGEGFETMGPAVPLLVERALDRGSKSGLAGLSGVA